MAFGSSEKSVVKTLMFTTDEGYSTEEREYPVEAGKIKLILPKTSAIVLNYQRMEPKKEVKKSLLFK